MALSPSKFPIHTLLNRIGVNAQGHVDANSLRGKDEHIVKLAGKMGVSTGALTALLTHSMSTANVSRQECTAMMHYLKGALDKPSTRRKGEDKLEGLFQQAQALNRDFISGRMREPIGAGRQQASPTQARHQPTANSARPAPSPPAARQTPSSSARAAGTAPSTAEAKKAAHPLQPLIDQHLKAVEERMEKVAKFAMQADEALSASDERINRRRARTEGDAARSGIKALISLAPNDAAVRKELRHHLETLKVLDPKSGS